MKKKKKSELDKQKEEEEFQLALALSLSESENKRTSFKVIDILIKENLCTYEKAYRHNLLLLRPLYPLLTTR